MALRNRYRGIRRIRRLEPAVRLEYLADLCDLRSPACRGDADQPYGQEVNVNPGGSRRPEATRRLPYCPRRKSGGCDAAGRPISRWGYDGRPLLIQSRDRILRQFTIVFFTVEMTST